MHSDLQLDTTGFQELLERLASAWSKQDTAAGVACFTRDAIYIEPPDIQFYTGHDQLRPYFADLPPGTTMRFRNVWFDEARQVGAGEYTFHMGGRDTALHGVAVVEVTGGSIAVWREYQRTGPALFEDFIAVEGKEWQGHIGNYP